MRKAMTMELIVTPAGVVRRVYAEHVNLDLLGEVRVRRAGHVEPDARGQWWADLSPVDGPRLGPFPVRSAALSAEAAWLTEHLPRLDLTLNERTAGCGSS